MNVYEKLQAARVRLQQKDIKRSGENGHAGFKYFELGDFLPHINSIFEDLKLFSRVSFDTEFATLVIINTEKPDERIDFSSPMAEANLRGVQAIQNIGAVQTYQRRYLYMMALEISEHDTLDAVAGDKKKRSDSQPNNAQKQRQAPRRNGAKQSEANNEAELLEKGRRKYFATAREKFDGVSDEEAPRNYAVWFASQELGRELESFNDIPLSTLRRVFARVRDTDKPDLLTEYDEMYSARLVPDEVPGFEGENQEEEVF